MIKPGDHSWNTYNVCELCGIERYHDQVNISVRGHYYIPHKYRLGAIDYGTQRPICKESMLHAPNMIAGQPEMRDEINRRYRRCMRGLYYAYQWAELKEIEAELDF